VTDAVAVRRWVGSRNPTQTHDEAFGEDATYALVVEMGPSLEAMQRPSGFFDFAQNDKLKS
jgi:hypothetical protein